MTDRARVIVTVGLVLTLALTALGCALGPQMTFESGKDKAARQLQEQGWGEAESISINRASGESHEMMASMILLGAGKSSDLDSYSESPYLVEVVLEGGETVTGVMIGDELTMPAKP